jgi:hypothetical protein
VLDFFKLSSGARTSPPVFSDIGGDDPDESPLFKRKFLLKLPLFAVSYTYIIGTL